MRAWYSGLKERYDVGVGGGGGGVVSGIFVKWEMRAGEAFLDIERAIVKGMHWFLYLIDFAKWFMCDDFEVQMHTNSVKII